MFCRFIAALFDDWIHRQPKVQKKLMNVEWVRALVQTFEDNELPAPAPDFHPELNS